MPTQDRHLLNISHYALMSCDFFTCALASLGGRQTSWFKVLDQISCRGQHWHCPLHRCHPGGLSESGIGFYESEMLEIL